MTLRLYRDGELVDEQPFDATSAAHAVDVATRVWVDAVDPTTHELGELQATFGLHELSIEDSRNWGQRSKLERFRDHDFIVVHGLDLDRDDELVDREVHLYVGRSFVLTIRRAPAFGFERTHDRILRGDALGGEGIGHLLYLILDEIVDGYLDVVERLEASTDQIQDRVDREDGSDGSHTERPLARDIFHLRRTVATFRRLVVPMREVVDQLQESPLVTNALAPYYRDVEDHVIRAIELLDNVRDILTSAREVQLALESKRLNVVMKKVTSWAAIILLPTLIAGIYGMNFRHMPELSWSLGYPGALASMAVAAGVLYWVFKRKDWL
ncbi:MAG TPA: magnesium/cobalt transporter CorA [Actinomycetota bacterium]|nr:magnesium/cobalt transporter CorA [Actinomycetota bacterium]